MTPQTPDLLNDPSLRKGIAWLWDPERRRIAWATEPAAVFWMEPSLLDVIARDFGPDDAMVRDLERHETELDDGAWAAKRLTLLPDSQLVSARAKLRRYPLEGGRSGILVEIGAIDEEPTDEVEMGAGALAQYAPVALGLFNVDGSLIAMNESAHDLFEALFAQRTAPNLAHCLGDIEQAGKLILRVLADGAYSRTISLETRVGPRDHRITARRARHPKSGAPALAIEFRDIHDTQRLWANVARAFEGLTHLSTDVLGDEENERSPQTPIANDNLHELEEARADAERRDREKTDFIAKLSHEMRTPLNAIMGFAEVMADGRFGPMGNERYQGYAEDIVNSSRHLTSLINDLLDLSKVEAGKLDLKLKEVRLDDLIADTSSLLKPLAEQAGVELHTRCPESLPHVVADERSIRQILINLASNAIKFSKAGSFVSIEARTGKEGDVVLEVTDQGMGMSTAELKVAMEPFGQVHGAYPDEAKNGPAGTGLGLPLAKALANANKADFTIDSAPEEGTQVAIIFPSTLVLAG